MTTEQDHRRRRRNAWLLDLRFVIAVMFTIFGVLVTFSGFTATNEQIEQAAGINISLWTGIGLLLLAAAFGVWVAKAPPEVAHSAEEPAEPSA